MTRCIPLNLIWLLLAQTVTAAPISLGSFTFDSSLFGDALFESDGGVHSATAWLNVVNSDPGNPTYLTGANFDTGIVNIKPEPFPDAAAYTILYSSGIRNIEGADAGAVVARFSFDSIAMSVSMDGGTTFTDVVHFPALDAVPTGVSKAYFLPFGGPLERFLYVQPIDFGLFGIPADSVVNAIRVTGSSLDMFPQLDLVRVAGFEGAAVPEPGSGLLAALGLIGLWTLRTRRRFQ